jgi:membrane-bound metal-dependent hydrolase YbcI (DUF457 family)
MTWRTHIAIGANAIWIAGIAGAIDQSIIVLLPAAIIASLLPDIDASAGPGAKIHYVGGGILGGFRGLFWGKYFHHRGLMHSFFVAALWFIILTIIFFNSYPLLAPIFTLSYLSHPIIDGLNSIVGYLYPFVHKRFALVPRAFYSRVGGPIDTLLLFIGAFGIVLFFAVFYSSGITLRF